jgi:signal transduction histidine kinase
MAAIVLPPFRARRESELQDQYGTIPGSSRWQDRRIPAGNHTGTPEPDSNGFNAATKRKEQDNNEGYEPTLKATTKSLGDRVEIRIRDNGTGVPPEVKEKMFNPFFTTKPAGEGTGLGLSITHDIIVKQHSGSIEIDSQPGEYTEIRIVLPRAGALVAGRG